MLGVGRGAPGGPGGPGAHEASSSAPGPAAGAAPGGAGLDERDAWVILNEADGVGPVSFGRLLGTFGTALDVLRAASEPGGLGRLVAATADPDRPPSLTPASARALAELAGSPERILGPVRRAGVWPLLLIDDAFPSRLRQIELPPPVLFVRGRPEALDRTHAVAIVGTRRPTEAGRLTAARIADGAASLGATIVSGLALGIDAAAHRACVRGGGPTVAVIGGGHERLYPAGHRTLVEEIVRGGGAVVGEFSPETIPTRGTFPRRNRIISGLADATVVVEAGARSGALTTAAWALEQSRGLFIVPGRLDDPAVAGSLAFLREAGPEARVVAGIPELLDDLGLLGPAAPTATGARPRPAALLASLPAVERSLATAIGAGRTSVDELVAWSGLGGATVLGALTALEIRGLVTEAFGRYRLTGPLAADGRRLSVPAVRVGARTRVAAGLAGAPPGRTAVRAPHDGRAA